MDAVLELYANIASGIVVYEKMIEKHVAENLPFMATENILMEGVKQGGDRQVLHERIRVLSHEATVGMRKEGKENELLSRIAEDPAFPLDKAQLEQLLDARLYTGRAQKQVEAFVQDQIDPLLQSCDRLLIGDVKV